MSLMNHENARGEDQRAVMARIAADGVCSFCPEHMPTYHKHPIEKTGTFWYVTKNAWPYEHTAHHFLLVTKEHLSDSTQLSSEAWAELHELQIWLVHEYEIKNGTMMMRTGDMSKTGSTVSHLHAHFIVGADPDKPVITRVG